MRVDAGKLVLKAIAPTLRQGAGLQKSEQILWLRRKNPQVSDDVLRNPTGAPSFGSNWGTQREEQADGTYS